MIAIKCDTGHKATLEELKPLQGSLKTLSEKNYKKLKQQMMDEGFIAPFFVWVKGDEKFLLDGHQRHYVLTQMEQQGISMPTDWPIVPVEAGSFKQACKRVLAISSQYGTITKKGLLEFVEKADITNQDVLEEYQFDAFEFDDLELDEPDKEDKEKEYAFGLFIKCEDSDQQAELLTEFKERDLEVKIKN